MQYTYQLVKGLQYVCIKSAVTGQNVNDNTKFLSLGGGKLVVLDGENAGDIVKPNKQTVWSIA